MRPRAMVVTDLDGTLFQTQRRISAENLCTLVELGEQGVLRVGATGRNLYSARGLLDASFPLDYLLFSSGAGIMNWPQQRLLRTHTLRGRKLRWAFTALLRRDLDFMVHHPIPENHHFLYYEGEIGRPNPDFAARCVLYGAFARTGTPGRLPLAAACQLLAVVPPIDSEGPCTGDSVYAEMVRELPELRVIRTTSPLDGRSCWIEIFPREVSKALAAAWVQQEAGVEHASVMAVGNDFNDLDLLGWASRSFAVRASPGELLQRFEVADSGPEGESDFTVAVRLWRQQTGL